MNMQVVDGVSAATVGCPALAPTADQAHVVEISTMYSGSTCIARFATGAV